MHGRLKVKTTEEQQEAKRKEREKKLKIYNAALQKIFHKREQKELDHEALELTGQVLSSNPDFYTLWNLRKEIFQALQECRSSDELQTMFTSELHFLETCLRTNPKSYGSWHHRCWVLDNMPQPDWARELKLCDKFLEYDERNFHCWDYRRFVVKRSQVSAEAELSFTDTKISTNFSNYSSWHYRSKLLPLLYPDPDNPVGVQEETLLKEYELVQNAVFTDPNDQSAWFYHRWLLGRDQPGLSIRSVYISRSLHYVTVTLSKPAKVPTEADIKVNIDGTTVPTEWSAPPSAGNYSQIWTCQLDQSSMPDNAECHLEVSLNCAPGPATCGLAMGQSDTWWQPHEIKSFRFSGELSAAKAHVLQQELDSCEQLHELEPDNKWVLLTIITLMQAVDPLKYESQMMTYIDLLIQVDPKRHNYYRDLRSKFLIENASNLMNNSTRHLNLSSKQLTSVSHLDHMTLMTHLDLSQNAISSIKRGYLLQCVKVLNLDKNQLRSCEGLEDMQSLEQLSIKANKIENVDDLQALRTCKQLQTVHIEDNPLCSHSDWKQELQNLLPNVKHIS